MLIKIGIVEIDYKSVLIFLIGLGIGLLLFGLVFLILLMSTRRNRMYVVKSKEQVSSEDATRLVDKAIEKFYIETAEVGTNQFIVAKDISFDLMEDISRLFFPKSKRPLYELSVDEIVELVTTVADNIERRLDSNKATKWAKRIKISTLVSIGDEKINNKSELKKTESKASYISKLSSFIIKKVNDVKAAVVKKGLNMFHVVPKVCELIIHICGEECYKVFAKKLELNTEIDTGIDNIVIEEKDED